MTKSMKKAVCLSVCVLIMLSGCADGHSSSLAAPGSSPSQSIPSLAAPLSPGSQAPSSMPENPTPDSSNAQEEPLAPDPRIYQPGGYDAPAVVPTWDERTIAEQYGFSEWEGGGYTLSAGKIDDSLIQKHLGLTTVSGMDYHRDLSYTADADAYSLKSISPRCAVAIKYKGYSGCFPFTADEYSPATLGELIDDLNLRENLVFNDITYSYLENQTQIYEYYQLPDAAIWDLLLSNPSLKNEGDAHYTKPGMRIPIDVKVIGSKNISLAVNDTGYLQTNILGSAKTFFIGQERVQAFVDYVRSSGNKLEPPTQADLSVPESDRPVYPN